MSQYSFFYFYFIYFFKQLAGPGPLGLPHRYPPMHTDSGQPYWLCANKFIV